MNFPAEPQNTSEEPSDQNNVTFSNWFSVMLTSKYQKLICVLNTVAFATSQLEDELLALQKKLKENDKDDRAINEYFQNDIKMNQQGHHIWTLTKIMHLYRYGTDSQTQKRAQE